MAASAVSSLPPRPSSEPIIVSSPKKHVVYSKAREQLSRADSGALLDAAVPTRLKDGSSGEDAGVSEIRKILQHGALMGSPSKSSWLGVSPPTRTTGAANPLVQDCNWRSNAYRCSHSNLQALREIDARGVSFLRASEIDSPPEFSLLGGSASDDTTYVAYPGAVSRGSSCQSAHVRVGTPISCQTGFYVA